MLNSFWRWGSLREWRVFDEINAVISGGGCESHSHPAALSMNGI
jgi:hypothetical protein